MVGSLILFIFLFLITQAIHNSMGKKHSFYSRKLMNYLFLYHFLFVGIYYTYAAFNNSDSYRYFGVPQIGDFNWFHFFGTGTTFIDFLGYPFINYFNFSYEMMMIFFGWFGYLGFLFAYLFFRENIPIKIRVFNNVDLLPLILFFPNMHFWSSSLGKGAPIFMGLMLFAYAIKRPGKRIFLLSLGAALVYFIRPHVFLFIAAATVLSLMSGDKRISSFQKFGISVTMIGLLLLLKDQILAVAGLGESENLVDDFQNFSENQSEGLERAGSGVDMSSYPIPLKLFTFWFRPLFFDAPGFLGLITSMENLIYVLLFLKILKKDFIKFILSAPFMVKMSLGVFLLGSLALSFVMANLGIIIRQKAMVMYFLFFVIYYYLAQKKYKNILKFRKIQKMKNESGSMKAAT